MADLDKDGEIDLAVTLYVEGKIELRKGDGKGGFAPAARFDTRGRLPHKVRVADMNDDGKQDLVVSHCYTDDSIVIFYGDGDFKFSVSQEILLGEDREVLEQEIRDIVVTDLNGDGRPDIAAACFAAGKISVFFNVSAETDLPQTFHEEAYPFKDARPRALCEADFNQDGATDLGVALWDLNAVALLLRKAEK
jgi:hypothetical protein